MAIPAVVYVGGAAALEGAANAYAVYRAYRLAEIAAKTYRLANVAKVADATLSKDEATTQACASCAKTIPCFKLPDKGDPDEMDRQLKQQEDKINSMKPEDVANNIDRFKELGRPNDGSARSQTRTDVQQRKESDLAKEYQGNGMSAERAEIKAASDAQDFMKGQDATHSLDWAAGGDGSMSGTGGSSENRSIGSQWGKKGEGESKTRAENLKDEAEKAKQENRKMNVKLKRC